MDLSQVSDADLYAYSSGNMSAISDKGIVALHRLHTEATPAGNNGGEGVAFGEGLANSVPAGQKITSAIGAGIAKAASPFTGDERSFGQLYKQANADTASTAAANPKSAMAGSATGIVSSLPAVGAAGRMIGAGADAVLGEKTVGALSQLGTPAADAGYVSRGANLGIRAAKGAAGAAPVGALYGAANDTSGDMGKGAAEGAEVAGALGAGLPVVGAGLGVAADIAGPATRAVASKVAPAYAAQAEQDVAMGKVIKRFHADFPDPDERQAALDKYLQTNDVGLAESAGKNTKNLALGAAQYPSGDVAANDYFGTRIGGAPARIANTFADQVSSNNDYFGTLEGITAKGRKAASPLYKTAYDANPSVSSLEIDAILKTPAGKKALGSAATNMLNDRSEMAGLSEQQVGEQARQVQAMQKMINEPVNQYAHPDTAVPEPNPQLNLRSLDYVKRALDRQYKQATMGEGDVDPNHILDLKKNLVSELDNADQTKSSKSYPSIMGPQKVGKDVYFDPNKTSRQNLQDIPNEVFEEHQAPMLQAFENYRDNMRNSVNEILKKNGHEISWKDNSRQSESEYWNVRNLGDEDEDNGSSKIRFSDHGDRHGGNDLNVFWGEHPESIARQILKERGINNPNIGENVGAYARARAVSGDYLKNSQAMDDGRNFMKPGTAGQPEEIAAKFKALGPAEQESYKAGMVRAVKEKIDDIAKTSPDNDALGANIYRKVFGTEGLQNRIKAVLNPSEFDVLSKKMQDEANLYEFRNKTISGSPTALKSISAEEFKGDGSEFMRDIINHGPQQAAIKKGIRWINSQFDGLSNKTAGEVSKILYETDPAKKLEILKSIQKNAQLNPAEKQTAIKAYYSVNSLFKKLSKTQAGVNNGEENE